MRVSGESGFGRRTARRRVGLPDREDSRLRTFPDEFQNRFGAGEILRIPVHRRKYPDDGDPKEREDGILEDSDVPGRGHVFLDENLEGFFGGGASGNPGVDGQIAEEPADVDAGFSANNNMETDGLQGYITVGKGCSAQALAAQDEAKRK